ncbi:MAG: tryptophan--tRNA ligase [Methanobacteriaceae archaeon]|nr:tryptophan--tRNA ligase [Methanobacteriaceae archaeon]
MIDPWGSNIIDYNKLTEQFGIKPFSEVLNDVPDPDLLMKRGIIFGQRDYKNIIHCLKNNKEYAVVTGMMPSGRMHIGHKMVVDQLKWYQKKGAQIYLSIADMESYGARGISSNKSRKLAIEEYIINYIALGIDVTDPNFHIYLQSENDSVKDLAYKIGNKITFNQMKAIYGFNNSTNISHIYTPLIQVADILHPQLEEHGGPKNIVVPVGPDQDPHIRLTRDIANKFNEEYGFIAPSSTYHRFMTGLTGEKMSSSKPKSAIYLTDTPKEASKKVKSAKTGGRESLKEQKEIGGKPDECSIYELLVYHLIKDDNKLKEIRENCLSGIIVCGDCKNCASKLIKELYENISNKREEAKDIALNVL